LGVTSPFYSTKDNHLGYGLWRAKNVIDRMGGRIAFESQLNKGTTFSIWLPLTNTREIKE